MFKSLISFTPAANALSLKQPSVEREVMLLFSALAQCGRLTQLATTRDQLADDSAGSMLLADNSDGSMLPSAVFGCCAALASVVTLASLSSALRSPSS